MEAEKRTITTDTLKEDFLKLSAIDAVSFREREMADVLISWLEELGFQVEEDNAGSFYDGNAGNIYAYLPGNAGGDSILFSGHMDTVEPGIGKKAIVNGDKITSDGTTVLGADDLAGIIPILRGIQMAIESGVPRHDIEILFTIAEELYVKGANVFDYSKLKSKEVYVLDMSGNPGRAAIKAPSIIRFSATITGKAAHAGFEPEAGIHAIAAMSRGIAELKNGRPDKESTFNIGTIEGGLATNIVPESCRISGEVRSLNHSKAEIYIENARKVLKNAADEAGAEFDFEKVVVLEAYSTDEDSRVVKRYIRACEKVGLDVELVSTSGGSDQNCFAKHGLSGIVLAIGAGNVHSTKEYCNIGDLMKNTQLVSELVKL